MWDLVVAGTLMFDEVTTSYGHRKDQPGGSALYAALAAAQYTFVHVVGALGSDGARIRRPLTHPRIDLTSVDDLPGRSHREYAVHDHTLGVTKTIESCENVYSSWLPCLNEAARQCRVAFLGSMRPALQLAVAVQMSTSFLVVDTMIGWIVRDRSGLEEVIDRADMLFVNEEELVGLVGSHDILPDAQRLLDKHGLTAVVVKGGSSGATAVTHSGILHTPAVPVARVVDPSGAGDAFAGGFLGYLAVQESLNDLNGALKQGASRAAEAIGGFGTIGLVRSAHLHL